ncbi:hypothetical protein L226DRAFT_170006 [Lentinus tigrinus ALCF2SS1-7]|uniref:uncharacterized protein n=1 Tax=Lentinus tigrinus ALCF2SS1-7 TaxID=1328758 RepID=UPI00116618C4|nr:hypothetical protein L226DRAFT_170006 [Lentinus tigrinus ALCF2SS1-7]
MFPYYRRRTPRSQMHPTVCQLHLVIAAAATELRRLRTPSPLPARQQWTAILPRRTGAESEDVHLFVRPPPSPGTRLNAY